MCTVTLVSRPDSPNGFILTSNRDEAVSRRAIPPEYSVYKSRKLYFPRDAQAGGTWIGVSDWHRCICLMNGAFEPHERKRAYRKSRGVVVKDFLASSKKVQDLMQDYDLHQIEAFTMILVDWNNGLQFYELVWDEEQRYIKELDYKDHIWSSSPLYDSAMKSSRKNWFEKLKTSEGLSAKSLRNFHQHTEPENKEFGLIIDRGFLKTQSTSQVVNSAKGLSFWYRDLMKREEQKEFLQFKA